MKLRQKNLRVFHIIVSDENSFLEFFEKNRVILKEFFLLIEGDITDSIVSELENNGICFKDIRDCNIKLKSTKNIEIPKTEDISEKSSKGSYKNSVDEREKVKVYDRPIRSGEEVFEDLPVVIFGRVNSGAKLFCENSTTIYGIIDGFVQCNGEFIILKGISKRGVLIFNGEILDREKIKSDTLQKISLKDNKIEIISV